MLKVLLRRWKAALSASSAAYGYAGSGLVHALLAVVALLIVVGSGRPSRSHFVVGDWSVLEDGDAQPVFAAEGPVDVVPFSSTNPLNTSVQHSTYDSPEPESDFVPDEWAGPGGGEGLPQGKEWLMVVASRPGTGTAPRGGPGEGRGGRGLGGLGDSFFGVSAKGQRIVYVVDCSGSMLTPHLEAQNRFQRLKVELRRSIESLSEDRKFFVIFFNDTSIPMPAPKDMQSASDGLKEKYLAWVDAQPADGGTEPADALRYALRLKPDTIFLLTDGSFSPKTARLLQVLNRERVTIHTIGFSESANSALLGGIAADHAGTYRFVP